MTDDLPEVDPLESAIEMMLAEAEKSTLGRPLLVERLAAIVREHIAEQTSPDLTLIAALVDAAGGRLTVTRLHMERANQGTVRHQEEPLTGALVFTRTLPLLRADA